MSGVSVEDGRRAQARDQGEGDDLAAAAETKSAPAISVDGVVAPLDQDVGLEQLDQRFGGRLVEDDHSVDAGEAGQEAGAVAPGR